MYKSSLYIVVHGCKLDICIIWLSFAFIYASVIFSVAFWDKRCKKKKPIITGIARKAPLSLCSEAIPRSGNAIIDSSMLANIGGSLTGNTAFDLSVHLPCLISFALYILLSSESVVFLSVIYSRGACE